MVDIHSAQPILEHQVSLRLQTFGNHSSVSKIRPPPLEHVSEHRLYYH